MADKKLRVDITAKDRTRQAFSRVQKSLGALRKSLFSIKGLIGAAFGALAVRSLARFVTGSIRAADAIAKTADKVGVTTDALQEYRFAADLAGVGSNTLDMALQRLTRRLGEAAQGKGELKDTLLQYGIAVTDASGRTRSTEAVMRDLANAIQGADSDAERLRIAFKAFDSEGAALVNVLREGSEGMEKMRQEARDLGLVIDESLLRKAEQTSDKLNILGKVLTTKFRNAVLENAEAIDKFADSLLKATKAIGEWVADMGPAEFASIESLNRRIITLRGEIESLEESWLTGAKLQVEKFVGPWARGFLSLALSTSSVTEQIMILQNEMEELSGIRAKRIQAEEMRKKPLPRTEVPEDSAAKIKREMEARHELNLVLTETPLLNRKWSEAMAQATREAEAQEAAIRDLSTSIETTLIDSLADLSTSFKDWRDVARAALRDVIRSMLQFVSIQAGAAGGGLGGLIFTGLGELFGPSTPTIDHPQPSAFRQIGGPVGAGQAALVGERGPEIFVPRGSGTVVPNHALGGVTVNQTINLSTGVQATVRAEVMSMLPHIAATTKTAVLSARVRGGAFANAFEG